MRRAFERRVPNEVYAIEENGQSTLKVLSTHDTSNPTKIMLIVDTCWSLVDAGRYNKRSHVT